jgi:hypothetical protein
MEFLRGFALGWNFAPSKTKAALQQPLIRLVHSRRKERIIELALKAGLEELPL